ncbi:MAG: M28 family peptidase [Pseudomonadota bacterium]
MKKTRLLVAGAAFLALGAYYVGMGQVEQRRLATPLANANAPHRDAPDIDQAMLLDDLRALASAEFAGRKTGSEGSRKAQAYLLDRFEASGLTPYGKSYAQPFAFSHTSIKGLLKPGGSFRTAYPAAVNLVGFVRGTRTPDKVMVISAHYDHLGVRDGQTYFGADDNASGVAALLAIANWFRTHPPLHTIVFAAFDGEEMGSEGAKAFMAALPFPQAQLAMNLNLDMLAHNDKDEIFVAGTRFSPELVPLVEQAARRSMLKVKLGHDRSQLTAGSVEDWTHSSDHGPFHDAGVAFLYVGVEDHADYHAPTDTVEHSNKPFYGKVASLVVDMAMTLDRNLDEVGPAKAQLK